MFSCFFLVDELVLCPEICEFVLSFELAAEAEFEFFEVCCDGFDGCLVLFSCFLFLDEFCDFLFGVVDEFGDFSEAFECFEDVSVSEDAEPYADFVCFFGEGDFEVFSFVESVACDGFHAVVGVDDDLCVFEFSGAFDVVFVHEFPFFFFFAEVFLIPWCCEDFFVGEFDVSDGDGLADVSSVESVVENAEEFSVVFASWDGFEEDVAVFVGDVFWAAGDSVVVASCLDVAEAFEVFFFDGAVVSCEFHFLPFVDDVTFVFEAFWSAFDGSAVFVLVSGDVSVGHGSFEFVVFVDEFFDFVAEVLCCGAFAASDSSVEVDVDEFSFFDALFDFVPEEVGAVFVS